MPVGPEFQDQPLPAVPVNQVPFFVAPAGGPNGSPFYETTVTISGTQDFYAVVGDSNLNDTLTVRWVANYPPYSTATTLLATPTSGDRSSTSPFASFNLTVNCSMFVQGADHDLVVILSDRPFEDFVSFSQLPWNYYVDDTGTPQLAATMTGWRIAGCP